MKGIIKIILGVFGLLILCVLVSNIYIYTTTKPYIYESVTEAPVAQTALVLGAAVLADGSLSPIFTDRADMAIGLYQAGKVTKILVSRDNSTIEYNEVNPVRLYLMDKGVPDKDIFLDYAGFDTYSSMYRARDIFSVSSILICTQSFHLPRSVFIARQLGIEAYGVNADVGHMLFRNNIREIFANEKAVLNLAFNRQPKFLGDKISITDDTEKEVTKTELIRVGSPQAGQVISSPVTVTGQARGSWFFEASFPLVVVDWDGLIIGTGFATADGDWMTEEFVPFTGTVSYDLATSTPYRRGAIILKKDNPSGLPENDDAVEIPIEFGEEKPSGPTSILPFESGVQGVVLRGPICPVIQNPPQPECDDQPFVTTVQVIEKNSSRSSLFASVETDKEGNYKVMLPPGEYRLQALGGQPFPTCAWEEITVESDKLLIKNLSCDTGIR
ncbi:YdcF family protein [Candidatus Nomurabacteria bacterium]|nr:YdcF family protein [Candidatus Nomurabacteria bacterium]